MRLLHTSDWHVGRTLRGRSRVSEHEAVLAEIHDIAVAEQVDVVVVAGDLFESAAPTAESEEVVYRALTRFGATGARTFVVAGNHDNPRRLRAVSLPFAAGGVEVLAYPSRPDAGGLVEGITAAGERYRIALLPFVTQRAIVRIDHIMDSPAFEHAQAYAERFALLVEGLASGFDVDAVNVVVAHAFVAGGTAGGGERPAHLAAEYVVPSTVFPAAAGYVALGHLHRPQQVPGPAALHYCGSPLQLDFGEADQTKSVNVVDLAPGLPAKVRRVGLTGGLPLRTVRGTVAELIELDPGAAPLGDGWLKVVLEEVPSPGAVDRLREHLGDRLVHVEVDPAHRPRREAFVSRRGRSPAELFDAYCHEEGAVDPAVSTLFSELLEECTIPDTDVPAAGERPGEAP
ncbi:MAG: exonuclease SbcCD subunit D [Microthrixaceae bacterium]